MIESYTTMEEGCPIGRWRTNGGVKNKKLCVFVLKEIRMGC